MRILEIYILNWVYFIWCDLCLKWINIWNKDRRRGMWKPPHHQYIIEMLLQRKRIAENWQILKTFPLLKYTRKGFDKLVALLLSAHIKCLLLYKYYTPCEIIFFQVEWALAKILNITYFVFVICLRLPLCTIICALHLLLGFSGIQGLMFLNLYHHKL